MPYYSFHDREHRPLGMGSLEKKVINYFRPRFKNQYKTETRGTALQSAAGEFMSKHGINPDQRALIIHFLKKHFRPVASDTDTAKTAGSPKKTEAQTELTFESVLTKHLLID